MGTTQFPRMTLWYILCDWNVVWCNIKKEKKAFVAKLRVPWFFYVHHLTEPLILSNVVCGVVKHTIQRLTLITLFLAIFLYVGRPRSAHYVIMKHKSILIVSLTCSSYTLPVQYGCVQFVFFLSLLIIFVPTRNIGDLLER